MTARPSRAAAVLGVLALLQFLPFWLRGLGSFWGDLFYIHWPWRAFDARALQSGQLPLWNPHLYFGMPAAASMQDSLYYPLTAPFFLFSFPTALMLFQLAHYWLAAVFCWLWLRKLGARPSAALCGAALYAFGGVLASNQGFLNHLSVLALWPAALLLAGHQARFCALALSLMFFAGYPPFWAGMAGLAVLIAGKKRGVSVVAATALLSCVLLLPGAELVLHSKRSSGVGLDEALRFGLTPADLLGWVTPLLAPGGFDPAVNWWRTCYLGVAGAALVVAGLGSRRRSALWLGSAAAAVMLLMLGESFAVSRFVWANFKPLSFVRYPGNLAYLALLPLTVLAALGASRLKASLRLAALAFLAAELTLLGYWGFKPAPRELWTRKGPLHAALQATLEGSRYLLSPLALETHAGRDVYDWAARLYGLTNAPYGLRAAGNFGEPLVPKANYALMDALYSATPRAVSAFLPWADVGALLSVKPIEGVPGLVYERDVLWSLHRTAPPIRAAFLSGADGERLSALAQAPAGVKPRRLPVEERGFGRLSVSGQTPAGWVYLAEPLFPGWRVDLETPLGPGRAAALPALGPFQRVSVPAGNWRLTWTYAPGSFAAGLWATLLGLFWLGGAGLGALKRSRA